jgi:hypothetical protein
MNENAREQMRQAHGTGGGRAIRGGDKTGEEFIELNEEVLYIKKYPQNMAMLRNIWYQLFVIIFVIIYVIICCPIIVVIKFLQSFSCYQYFFKFLYSSLVLLSYFRFSALLLFLFYSL